LRLLIQASSASRMSWVGTMRANCSLSIARPSARWLFRSFGKSADTPNWRGCGFLRTIAELASTPGHPAIKAGAAHKKRFETWMADMLERDGVRDAEKIARQIVILLDGAATVMLIHRDAAYVETAGDVAADLVEQSRAAKEPKLTASR
jgi:hypothetical protein